MSRYDKYCTRYVYLNLKFRILLRVKGNRHAAAQDQKRRIFTQENNEQTNYCKSQANRIIL